MMITLELRDAAIETLGAKTSADSVPHLRLAATMKHYALERLVSRVTAESVGNGRVEFLDRLAKFGARFSERTTWDLVPGLARLRSILG
jgi:hypothetical protein